MAVALILLSLKPLLRLYIISAIILFMAASCENDPASPDVPPTPKPPVEDVVEGRIPVIKVFTTDGQSVVSKEDYKTGTIAISDPDHL